MQRPDSILQAKVAQTIAIRPSTIPGAGLGAFALEALPANRVIGLYRGEVIDAQEFDRRYPHETLGEYVLQVSKRTYVDARDPATSNWTRYINDGHVQGRNLCNVRFTSRGGVRTKRFIHAGEELFISYGPHYF